MSSSATEPFVTQVTSGVLSRLKQTIWIENLIRTIKGYGFDTIPFPPETNVTSLCEQHLKCRLARHDDLMSRRQPTGAATLASMSIGKIIELLRTSDDLEEEVRTLASNLNSATICDVLRDPRVPYPAIHACLIRLTDCPSDALEDARDIIDIDEAILTSEQYLRSEGPLKQSGGLLTLNDLANLLVGQNLSPTGDSPGVSSHIVFRRKEVPKGGLELLGKRSSWVFWVQSSIAGYISAFNSITNNILDGLNWDNVFVAGDIVLTALVHGSPSEREDRQAKDWGIDIYIYGLGPNEANEKIREIYRVWESNLPTYTQRLVVKNRKTIIFLADYPTRRIQIILKLAPSPLQVLFPIDHDERALGFDGKDVLMLPRCVRALQTGYSIFKMDLVWGDHPRGDLSEELHAVHEARGFHHSSRGFGLRITPSYIKLLKKDYPLAYTLNPSSRFDVDETSDSRFARDPLYTWDGSFDHAIFTQEIDMVNSSLFAGMRIFICKELGLPFQNTGWSNYLTRRIRSHVYGDDLDAVMEKQITLPVLIPLDLEHTIHQYMNSALTDAGIMNDSYRALIPVHTAGAGTTILPDLEDTTGPHGNVRYWVISNETMWAGIDHRIDAVFEILGTLFHHKFGTNRQIDTSTDELRYLARDLRRRLPPDSIEDKTIGDGQGRW
ncbi:MAG: hypothetical protein M1836_006342 [Candelina mexicana]|nr:MAG: hypothetical protein M1836_006342 [Candelina mexicana]